MSISVGSRLVAEPSFRAIHGMRAAGAYLLRFSLDFMVYNWPEGEQTPSILLLSAPVAAEGGDQTFQLGYAVPEIPVPFVVGPQGQSRGLTFDLLVPSLAMEAVERLRDGDGINFRLKIQAQISVGFDTQSGQQEILCRVSQSEWLAALENSHYRRRLLLEIPVPNAEHDAVAVQHLSMARTHLMRGHYEESVSACRKALEGWTTQRNEGDATKAAREMQKRSPRELTLYQRELLLRQAASNYADLAHHADDVANAAEFDRDAAVMMIAVTAAILSR